ncbi:MAG: efflux RND transporter periplasmic adaptor subunit [Deltaproteobacteria bacterium]|jgi:RND family efflux transporter MFP subunit|nr:efflux RND transporter periplasmic adaptor subunit [Deltaproteobacteria bacterium]
MEDNQQNDISPEKQPNPVKSPRPVVRIVLSLLILGVGIGAASYLKNSAPRTQKRPPVKLNPTVQIQTVKPSSYQIVVTAMGTVVPSREVILKSRVSGEIIEIHPEFTEGGFLKKDMKILQIDPKDYELALARKQSAVTDAEYALKLELGHQTVAKREWDLLNQGKPAQDMEKELALRQPHLNKARADLSAAEAELKAAMLDLERTHVVSPFNAMVRSKSVDLGSQVTPQEPLAELVGTDAYRIQVSLPVDRLEWIDVPVQVGDPGSKARIVYGQGHECIGTVVRLMGDLATEGRMARVLVEVADPLGLKASNKDRSPLLIGEYVRVEIQGRKLDSVFQIPRAALRDHSNVWVAGENQTLEIRNVHPIWRAADIVLLKDGLKSGERLIVSDLPAPVQGMPVRVDSSTFEMESDQPIRKNAPKDKNS